MKYNYGHVICLVTISFRNIEQQKGSKAWVLTLSRLITVELSIPDNHG